MTGLARTPRALHPIAWWLWALGLVAAASRITNPVLLAMLLAVLGFVIAQRRTDAPWARAFKYYLAMALVVIAIRVVFRSVFTTAAAPHEHVLFSLPLVHSPHWYAGVRLGGPVSIEGVLSATCDGLQLGTILCCIGAANVLANPKRALRVLPGALYELGVAVVVALSVAPQLVESAQRVRRARRLRAGHRRGLRGLRSIAVPVLEDALDRSLQLAAGMDSRGYGRTGAIGRAARRRTATLLLLGMLGLCVGTFGLLDAAAPWWLGLPTVVVGAALCVTGLLAGGRRIRRTVYRPDPWRAPEWVVAAGGVACAAVLLSDVGFGSADLVLSVAPLRWPTVPVVPAAAILLAGLAALAAPVPTPARAQIGRVDELHREPVAA
jgi:energy-coupling factor transport system permease protein